MPSNTVPVSESLTFAWETFKKNALFLIGVVVAAALVNGAVEIAREYGYVESGYLDFVLGVIEAIINGVISMGLIAIMLKFKDGSDPEFIDLFNRAPLIFYYLGATILYALGVVIGLVFFIVPGIYIAVRFAFYGYFIVDEGVDPITAFAKSSELTQDVRLDLFFFGLAMFGICILGVMALGVGILVASPITMLATASVFRHLQGQMGRAPATPRQTD